MISVIASIQIKENCLDSFLEIFKSNIPNVMNEEGCVEYAPTIDLDTGLEPQALDPNVVTIIEKWETLECLQSHLTAPPMQEYKAKVADLVEHVSL
jgi:quinol monooxygenase YgiN